MKPRIVLTLDIAGKAQPGGSKSAHLVRGKGGNLITRGDGTPIVTVADANKKTKPWQLEVKAAVRDAWGDKPLLTGPLFFRVTFTSLRPDGHFRAGKFAGQVKDSAPAYPTTRPDVLKLTRAVEDALTGVVWRDDSQIVAEPIFKRYGDKPGVRIEIGLLPATVEESRQWMESEKTSC